MSVNSIEEKDITICGHGSGKPSIKNLRTYTSQRYATKAPNGKKKGIVAVKRFKAMTDAKRKKFHDTYKTIIGRNVYSQSLRSYVYTKHSNGRYYSDCSSSGMATLAKIGFKVSLLNTAGIYNSDLFETVKVKIKDGHITNPEVLKVGDAILYIGNDPKRPKQIGHVEWVYTVPEQDAESLLTKKTKYKGAFPTLPSRGYFTMGDTGEEVKKLQALLNWITSDKIDVDGIFGKVTRVSVTRAQELLAVKIDGKFGKKTLAAAKEYKQKENKMLEVLK